jgi:predicted amidohydrolase
LRPPSKIGGGRVKIRVCGAQIPVTPDIDSNVKAIERAMDRAVAEGADILLTPEGSLSGYTHTFDAAAARTALEYVTGKAQAARLGLALGTCFVEPDRQCYNQIRFYAPDGEYLGFHSKTLRCGSMTEPPEGEISHYAVQPLRTYDFNGIRVGGLICNDLWANPACTPLPDSHLTQQLSQAGARIIFHAVNGGRSGDEWSEVAWRYHESNLRLRANAGKLWIVTVDSCHPMNIRCSAPSGVVDPRGNWACIAPSQGEHFFSYTIEV